MDGEIYKKPDLVDNGPTHKKISRNQRKKLAKERKKPSDQPLQESSVEMNSKVMTKEMKENRLIQKLGQAFPYHSQEQLKQSVRQNGHNFANCSQWLVMLEPQQQEKSMKMNFFLEQLFNNFEDNQQSIDEKQFECLFQDITEMLNYELGRDSQALPEIHKEICQWRQNLVKPQISDFTDQDAYQRQGLQELLQGFIERLLRQQKQSPPKKIFTDDQFPALQVPASTNKSVAAHNFNQNQWIPKYRDIRLNDYQPQTSVDLQQLLNCFPDLLDLKSMKLIYSELNDIELCKKFIKQIMLDKGTVLKKHVYIQNVSLPKTSYPPKKIHAREKPLRQKISPQIASLSYQDLRNKIKYLMRIRYLLARSTQKVSQGSQKGRLKEILEQRNVELQQCMSASRDLYLKSIMSRNPCSIDLHYHYKEQVTQLLDQLIYFLISHAGSQKVPISHKRILLTVITGKGRHSKGTSLTRHEKYFKAIGLKLLQDQRFQFPEWLGQDYNINTNMKEIDIF